MEWFNIKDEYDYPEHKEKVITYTHGFGYKFACYNHRKERWEFDGLNQPNEVDYWTFPPPEPRKETENKFENSENSTYDDLKDIIFKAFSDGVLDFKTDARGDIITIFANDNETHTFKKSKSDTLVWHEDKEGNRKYRVQKAIDVIETLYPETFIIGTKYDISRIVGRANIALLNGIVIEVSHVIDNKDVVYYSDDGSVNNYTNFLFLKGAEVKQKREN